MLGMILGIPGMISGYPKGERPLQVYYRKRKELVGIFLKG